MLTPLEHRMLRFIRAFIAGHGQGPTLVEIGAAVGINSKGTVHRYVQSLRDKGVLEHAERGWRGIRLADDPHHHPTILPLAGRIAAGHPIEAIAGQEEINLGEFFLGPGRYALEVKGDSMIEAGILEGDYVIIERRETADDGDIVVALVDDNEATLKRFKRLDKHRIELIPAHPSLLPLIYSAERVCIQGVLVGQLRRYS